MRLKYSLNIQKPVSLTCENIRLPAPTDNTISSGGVPGPIKGKTMPDAVNAATVAEPNVTLSDAVMSQAKSKGDKFNPPVSCFTVSPMPLSIKICLKAPPAAIIKTIMAMLFTPSVQDSIALAIEAFCSIKVSTTERSSAAVGSARNTKTALLG
ncbi:hypothetical protein D3C73_1232600 [compost metagenome]